MINADDHLEDLLEKYPDLNRSLRRRGLICVQCGEVYWGTLGELILEKKLDLEQVLKELNDEFKTS